MCARTILRFTGDIARQGLPVGEGRGEGPASRGVMRRGPPRRGTVGIAHTPYNNGSSSPAQSIMRLKKSLPRLHRPLTLLLLLLPLRSPLGTWLQTTKDSPQVVFERRHELFVPEWPAGPLVRVQEFNVFLANDPGEEPAPVGLHLEQWGDAHEYVISSFHVCARRYSTDSGRAF